MPGVSILFKFVSITLSSWLLVHVLAIFGGFIAFAYPIWWYLSPENTVCLVCHAGKEQKWCSFCRRAISKTQLSPKSIRSAFLNGILILFFSVISGLVVYAEYALITTYNPSLTGKSASFLVPSSNNKHKIGEIFPMEVFVEGIKTPINTVQIDLSFDPSTLEAIKISTDDSFATVFIDKVINNEVGYTRLTGGLPNPGYDQSKGYFGTVYFKGKIPGVALVEFLPTSVVLANNGRGTNVLKTLGTASFLILPETVSPEETASQEVKLNPLVLGESTDNTKLYLYEENDILGTQSESTMEEVDVSEQSIFTLFLDVLHKVDELIISFWKNIFDFVLGK